MRILFLSTVYPTPYEPTKGPFNRTLVESLSRHHDVRVVAPVPWPIAWGRGRTVRSRDTADPGRPSFPTYYYAPSILRQHYGTFMWHSVRRSLIPLLESFRPEVVLGYWTHPDGEAAVRAARAATVPAVIISGGSDVLLLTRDALRRRVICGVLQKADAVLAVGHELKTRIVALGISPHKIHVLRRGVDRAHFAPGDRARARSRLGVSPHEVVLLWVGRMVPVKGLDVLLEACVRLRARGFAFRLFLVGDGPLRTTLARQAESRGLREHVIFIGSKPHHDLPDWYRAADLTVLPSRSEGVPNVLLESLACGTPFVASRVGGVADLTSHPERDLVPPEDPIALAGAVERHSRPRIDPELDSRGWFDVAASASIVVETIRSVLTPRPLGGEPTGGVGEAESRTIC